MAASCARNPGVVGRPRVGDERVAIDLAEAQGIRPRLDDREVVEIVAVQDEVDPAPRLVATDRLRGSCRAAASRRGRAAVRRARSPRPTSSSRAPGGARCTGRSHRRRSRRPTASGPCRWRPGCSRSRAPASRRCGRCARRATSPVRPHPTARHRAGARQRRPGRPTTRRGDPRGRPHPTTGPVPRRAGRERGRPRALPGEGRSPVWWCGGVIETEEPPWRARRGWLRAGRRARPCVGTPPRPPRESTVRRRPTLQLVQGCGRRAAGARDHVAQLRRVHAGLLCEERQPSSVSMTRSWAT